MLNRDGQMSRGSAEGACQACLANLLGYPISAVRYWGDGVWIACCPSGAANRLLSCVPVLSRRACFSPLFPPILLLYHVMQTTHQRGVLLAV